MSLRTATEADFLCWQRSSGGPVRFITSRTVVLPSVGVVRLVAEAIRGVCQGRESSPW